MHKLLPVALDVRGKECLVVGGGVVAERKVKSLLECEANVTVVSPSLSQGLTDIENEFRWVCRAFESLGYLGSSLIFACTNDLEVNHAVAIAAHSAGIWCNIADDPAGSEFHSAAAVRRGEICIGITTGSGSPALSKHLRRKIEELIGPEYQALLELLAEMRVSLESIENDPERRAAMWRSVIEDGEIRELLREGRRGEATERAWAISSILL